MDAIKPCPADPNVYWGGTYTPSCCRDYSTTGDITYLGITPPPMPSWMQHSTFSTDKDAKLANEIELEQLRKKLNEVMEESKKMKEKFDPVGEHLDIIGELHALYSRKNHDYGDSFHKTYLEEGLAMCRIRLIDKMERFKRLSHLHDKGERGQVSDESLRDTLMDLANYALMSVMELDREKAKSDDDKEIPIEIKHLD